MEVCTVLRIKLNVYPEENLHNEVSFDLTSRTKVHLASRGLCTLVELFVYADMKINSYNDVSL